MILSLTQIRNKILHHYCNHFDQEIEAYYGPALYKKISKENNIQIKVVYINKKITVTVNLVI